MKFKKDNGEIPVVNKKHVKPMKCTKPEIIIPKCNYSPIGDENTISLSHGTLYPPDEHVIKKYVIGVGYDENANKHYITSFELEDVVDDSCDLRAFVDKVIGTRLDPCSIMNLFDGENGLGLPYILDLTYILNTTYENSKSMFIRSVDWFEKIKDFDKIFKKYESLKVRVSPEIGCIIVRKDRTMEFNVCDDNQPWILSNDWILNIPIINNRNTLKYNIFDMLKLCKEYVSNSNTSDVMRKKYSKIIELCEAANTMMYHVTSSDTFENISKVDKFLEENKFDLQFDNYEVESIFETVEGYKVFILQNGTAIFAVNNTKFEITIKLKCNINSMTTGYSHTIDINTPDYMDIWLSEINLELLFNLDNNNPMLSTMSKISLEILSIARLIVVGLRDKLIAKDESYRKYLE